MSQRTPRTIEMRSMVSGLYINLENQLTVRGFQKYFDAIGQDESAMRENRRNSFEVLGNPGYRF